MAKKKWDDPWAKRESEKYAAPVPSRELIIEQLKQHQRPITHRQLLNLFAIEDEEETEALRRRLRAMVRDRQIVETHRRRYAVIDRENLIEGRIRRHKDGHGSLSSSDYADDLYLSAYQMRQVFDGDIVLVRIVYDKRQSRRQAAIIVKVVKRAHKQIIGRYCLEGGVGFVMPMNKRILQNVVIPANEAQQAKDGQVVIATITAQPSEKSSAVGRISKILGNHMAPGMETTVALYAHDIPHRWPREVTQSTRNLHKDPLEADKKGRADLRQLPFVTIDGETAKDFDDAVYAEKHRFGGWNLYVAIADVSHYVQPNSALDEEAFQRGNSVYFPGKVIPMLPPILSNHLCSLNPHVDRLCMVCEMSISRDGNMTRYKFYPAVIHSHARLTYTEVGAFFAQQKTRITDNVKPHLTVLHNLYKKLESCRFRSGAIAFNTTEVEVLFGRSHKIKQLVPVVRNDAHKLIEECMLRANQAAAKFLLKNRVAGLYRTHSGPKPERLEELRDFLGELGLRLKGGLSPSPQDYSEVLRQAAGRADCHLIEMMLLRSMTQALYTPDNIGHFSLNFDQYTHFTSPIRRYPDVIIHRTIKDVLNKKKEAIPQHDTLLAVGEHCSTTERRADDATREVLSWLKCEYMLEKIGQEFNGVISSVTNFGLFIELENIFVEGLLHITVLEDDHYQFDSAKQCLFGHRRGKRYALGDAILIKVARVDLDKREIDFALTTPPPPRYKKKRRRSKNS
ncbi:MAG: ribonuclease R [Gammaproteobacteria bacterium]|nr:ribonuclease R [Gammaproteobacteria bacterium]